MRDEDSLPEEPPADPPPEAGGPVLGTPDDAEGEVPASGGVVPDEPGGEDGEPPREPAGTPAKNGTGGEDGGGARDDDRAGPSLEDADPDEAQLADKEREEGERAAFDARVDGLRGTMFGGPRMFDGSRLFDGTQMSGDRARLYQAEFMAFMLGDGAARPRVGAVSARQVRTQRRSYVTSGSYPELLGGFAHSPVWTLLGPRGHGRTTMAVIAVAEHVAPGDADVAGKVHIIQADGGIGTFDGSTVPESSGLVLVLDPGEPAPGAAWVGQVAQNLIPRGSVLVVVADTMPVGSAAFNSENVIQYVMPPLNRVFGRHLTVRLGEVDAAEVAGREVVRAEFGRCRTPREAARLAHEIADGRQQGREPEDVVDDRDPTEMIEKAHDELVKNPRWLRAFLVVCVVLDGLAAGTATRETVKFAALLPTDGVADGDHAEGLSGPIGEWSGCVELVGATGGTGRTVRLVHPRLVPKILEEVWQDHVRLRDALLAWLKELAVHPDVRVRVKGAQAVAKLATYDFDVIKREVLRVWAGDGGFRTRQAAAWALEALVLADGGRFAGRVRSLVRGWARSGNVRLQAAGVAAYGTFLGAEYPDEALDCMRRIAGGRLYRADGRRDGVELAERELANIVQQALLDVFLAGAQEKVVHELARWTRLPVWRWRRCAARCLVRLARRNGELPGWPLLMELADGQAGFRADVAVLWRNALAAEHNDAAAWDALRHLISLAETADRTWPATDDPTASGGWSAQALRFHTLTRRLLTDIAAGDSPADRTRGHSLRFHVQLWEFQDRRRLTVVPASLR